MRSSPIRLIPEIRPYPTSEMSKRVSEHLLNRLASQIRVSPRKIGAVG